MDSDSSLEEDRNRWNKQAIRPNMNDENSDVSDEENISRAARSIESPPESPQGTHFESPPASPDPENKPGTPSPIQSPEDSASYGSPIRSPDSQMDSRQLKNESPPKSPDSYRRRSQSPVSFANRSPPRSPSPIQSPSSSHSLRNKSPNSIQSPVRTQSPHSPSSIQSPTPTSQCGNQSPSQRSQSANSIRSPSPYHSRRRSESPDRPIIRDASESPGRSQSPMERDSPRHFKGRRSPSRSPPSTQRVRRDSNNSEDGRSNISSASSFSSIHQSPPPRPKSPPQPPEPTQRVKTVAELKSHVEDLSDVSDLESLNSMSDDEPEKPQHKENGDIRGKLDSKKDMISHRSTSGLEADDTEQLDFEAEEKEEGECDMPPAASAKKASKDSGSKDSGPATEAVLSEDEGELRGDELEEGEITDEGENRPEETEPRPVCRFYNRGQCTWGSSCRFVHPGVTDKGNYTMFEMVRPLVPVNGPPPMYGPPIDPYRPIERPMIPPMYQQPPPRKEEVVPAPLVESAWERGLRQAKEMLRKSSKRKETEVDFEEKKMNLSIGQDELDKENDYYTRPASPVVEESDRWGGKVEGEPKRYRVDRYEDPYTESSYYPRSSTEQVWHQRPHYDESMRGVYSNSRSSSKYYSASREARSSREKEYYSAPSSKKTKYSQREVIVQRPEKTSSSWKDDSPPVRPSRYTEGGRTSGRGDEWADPWMRSKTSPLSRKRSRKQSYSSGSSYSSSSSRSSSRSSSSSYSRSRSRSHSSRSRSRDKASKMSPPRRLLRTTSPLSRGPKVSMVPAVMAEKKVVPERSIMMNPPPPSPRTKPKVMATNPSPPIERARGGVSAAPSRLLAHSKAASAVAAAMRSTRSRSRSSRSSSNSDSSGSSSDSSESSLSSSSSASPPVPRKRMVIPIDERLALAQAMKVKAMDALKLSGQKQQIKLTLKGSGTGVAASTIVTGKKRPAESPPMDFSPPKMGSKTTPKKPAPSRREELLKQLKAVEDAIARKRSKIS